MNEVILFDGVCNFCHAAINFVIDHDPQHRYRFASLQSDYGQKLLQKMGRSSEDFDTVLLLRGGVVYEKSTAALEIARYLKRWSWLYGLRWLPQGFRDFFYDLIARYRYRIFGRSESCRLPTPQERALFL
ncbi:MAG: thiol-disulfide oxidoreductase DCC family protein [Runella sp.]